MNKVFSLGAGAIGVAAVALGLGSGVASADDVVGQKYSDAKTALSGQGLTPVVATTIGGRTALDDCIVTSATPAAGLNGYGQQSSGTMKVNLDCNAK